MSDTPTPAPRRPTAPAEPGGETEIDTSLPEAGPATPVVNPVDTPGDTPSADDVVTEPAVDEDGEPEFEHSPGLHLGPPITDWAGDYQEVPLSELGPQFNQVHDPANAGDRAAFVGEDAAGEDDVHDYPVPATDPFSALAPKY